VSPEALISFGRSVAGKTLNAPTYPRLVRPGVEESRRLLRLHAEAGRIAATSPDRIVNPAVMRALDQNLMALLINCLASGDVLGEAPAREQQVRLCVQFEHMIGAEPFRLFSVREICEAIGVSEKKLRASCLSMLGVGPGRYQRLRRLKLVRAALRRPGVAGRQVGEVVARYGFADLHHFVADYWQIYGEMPPIPPRDK
jgi:AraC-like DNA-binding protein